MNEITRKRVEMFQTEQQAKNKYALTKAIGLRNEKGHMPIGL